MTYLIINYFPFTCHFLNSAIIQFFFFFFFFFNLDGMALVPVVGPPVKYISLTLLWGVLKPSQVLLLLIL